MIDLGVEKNSPLETEGPCMTGTPTSISDEIQQTCVNFNNIPTSVVAPSPPPPHTHRALD